MYDETKETLCNCCEHGKVCAFKAQLIAAQQAVDNICVHIGVHTMKDLRDFDWIKPVRLECIHFIKQRPTARDISKENSARGIIGEHMRGFMEDPT